MDLQSMLVQVVQWHKDAQYEPIVQLVSCPLYDLMDSKFSWTNKIHFPYPSLRFLLSPPMVLLKN